MDNGGNNPAIPTPFTDGYGSIFQGLDGNGQSMWCSVPGGFTKREVLAKDFMMAMMSNPAYFGNPTSATHDDRIKDIASAAIHAAECLLDAIAQVDAVKSQLNK